MPLTVPQARPSSRTTAATVALSIIRWRSTDRAQRRVVLARGRSAAVFSSWLEERSAEFRAAVEVVAMDGFAGTKTAFPAPMWVLRKIFRGVGGVRWGRS